MQLEDWQQRVVEELDGLVLKLNKLHQFMDSEIFQKLTLDEQDLLEEQFTHMEGYYDALYTRIKRFRPSV